MKAKIIRIDPTDCTGIYEEYIGETYPVIEYNKRGECYLLDMSEDFLDVVKRDNGYRWVRRDEVEIIEEKE